MKIFVVGSLNMDIVISTDVIPDKGQTVSGYGFMTNPGGKGANQAVAAAKSGGSVSMIGAVGKDFGSELISALSYCNVDCSGVKTYPSVSSGIAVIVVSGGDNRIILDAGANALIEYKDVERGLADACSDDFLVTQLEVPIDIVLPALNAARAKGMSTLLNPAPARALPDEVFAVSDYFVPNQSETEFYTGIYPDTIEKAGKAAKILRDKGVQNVIITMGEKGAAVFTASESFTVEASKVTPYDTTAAGDTFVGAMTAMLSEGVSLKEAIKYANCAAGITVTRKGAQQSIPLRGEVETCRKKLL